MLAIARGLMVRPLLLMLDEPSLGLAPLVVERIFAIIREVNGEGTPILLPARSRRPPARRRGGAARVSRMRGPVLLKPLYRARFRYH